MPRAGPLKQILRSLTVNELRALRNECCPRVTEYDGDKAAFVDRLRNSLQRSMDEGEFSYEKLMEFVRDQLTNQGPERATTRIRHVLEEIEISKSAGNQDSRSVREHWISSELFQGLQCQFEAQPYRIEQEAQFGRNSVDLLVTHERQNRNYIIETKLAGRYSSRERLLSQLRRYRKKVPELRRTFVFMVAERTRDLPTNKEAVEHVVGEARAEPDTEVIVKPPNELRY